MANQTLVEDYVRLSMVNREYGRNRSRWQFLLDSFVGGDDYRRAGYLTKYSLESDAEYNARLKNTALDNHCSSIISTYMSFLFRNDPDRNFGQWEGIADLDQFLENTDYEGRSFNAFMKETAIWASVFGHTWVIMNKPDIGATTLAQELESEVRPYMNLMSPLVVNDWAWHRHPNGAYELIYIKYIEDVLDKMTVVKEWTKDEIKTWLLDDQRKEATIKSVEKNGLGIVPAICVYNRKSIVRGQGVSDINDIADMQKMIYNMTSEIEQSIRLDGHPSLVVPPTAQLGSGAGALIVLQDGSDPGLNPYYLQTNGANVTSIRDNIADMIDSINTMANVGSVRAVKAPTAMSGVALETEFQLLNARLSEKADSLELAEEQLWRLFGMYQGRVWDGYVKYPDSFSMRDVQREFTQLQTAKAAATDPTVYQVIDYRLRELLEDPRLPEAGSEQAAAGFEEAMNAFLLTPEETLPTATTATTTATTATAESCPIATQDVSVNLKNRQTAINKANYGPMNPGLPNRTFWMAKANIFNTTVAEAKTALCGNCAAFNKTSQIENCIDQGLAAGGSGAQAGWDTIARADLGYCEMWDFKCAATRTCDAWVTGGPVTD